MKKVQRVGLGFLIVAVVLFVSACWFRGYLPVVTPTVLANGEALKKIRLPQGFQIATYAENVPGARSMTLSPNGVLFVGTRKEGKVYALRDANEDFVADEVITIAENLQMPNGVAFRDGALYVAEISRVLKFSGIEKDYRNSPKPEIITDNYPTEEHHGWKFIAFGPDGKLYVPVGAPCNICNPTNEIFSTITRLDADGQIREIFARGIRNTVGFDWHPQTKELWFTDNGADRMGENVPPDELNHAPRSGMHFGFPYCHGRGVPDPEFNSGRDCKDFIAPALELGPHVAALGMRFYTGKQFPKKYRDGIFIAEHGSWNRKEPIGYRVMFVPFKNGRPSGYEVFAEGWLQGMAASGRPVDVLILPDGSLLVSDDKAGKIYRIFFEPQQATTGAASVRLQISQMETIRSFVRRYSFSLMNFFRANCNRSMTILDIRFSNA